MLFSEGGRGGVKDPRALVRKKAALAWPQD